MKTFNKFVSTVDPYKVVKCDMDCFSPYVYVDFDIVKTEYPDLMTEIEGLSDVDREEFDDLIDGWVNYTLPNGG